MHEGHSHKSGSSIFKWIAIGCAAFLVLAIVLGVAGFYTVKSHLRTIVMEKRNPIVDAISDETVKTEVGRKYDETLKLELGFFTVLMLAGHVESITQDAKVSDEELKLLQSVMDAAIKNNGSIPMDELSKFPPKK